MLSQQHKQMIETNLSSSMLKVRFINLLIFIRFIFFEKGDYFSNDKTTELSVLFAFFFVWSHVHTYTFRMCVVPLLLNNVNKHTIVDK
jgi:hypothetical protein